MDSLESLNKSQLLTIIRLGRKEFLADLDRQEMLKDLLKYPEFRGITKAKTVNDYFTTKTKNVTYAQVFAGANWIKDKIGIQKFSILQEHSLGELTLA